MPKEAALPPVRRYVHPEPDDDWPRIARRVFAGEDEATAVARLQSWNLHLTARPPTVPLTPLDVLFVEPPNPGPPVDAD